MKDDQKTLNLSRIEPVNKFQKQTGHLAASQAGSQAFILINYKRLECIGTRLRFTRKK